MLLLEFCVQDVKMSKKGVVKKVRKHPTNRIKITTDVNKSTNLIHPTWKFKENCLLSLAAKSPTSH